ncbi:MAG: hypothetical protein V4857_03505 [Pseudomonadota bacterium]
MQLVHTHMIHGTDCLHCGQSLPVFGAKGAKSNWAVVGLCIGLHVLGLFLFLAWSKMERLKAATPADSAIVYVAPMLNMPKAQMDTPAAAQSAPVREVRTVPPAVAMPVAAALLPPNVEAITLPLETSLPSPAIPLPAIAQPPAANLSERSDRLASLNAESRKKAGSGEGEDNGGVFSIVNMSRRGADIKFRGWNPNFKGSLAEVVHVETKWERDTETAIIKKLIVLIRAEKPGDFLWYSHRLGRQVTLNARADDEAELFEFLMREMFPQYYGL